MDGADCSAHLMDSSLTDCRNTTALARCERSIRQSSRIPAKRSVSTRNVSSAYVQNSQAVRQYHTARAPATPQTDPAPRHRTIIFKLFGIKLRRKHAAQLAALPLPSAPLTARARSVAREQQQLVPALQNQKIALDAEDHTQRGSDAVLCWSSSRACWGHTLCCWSSYVCWGHTVYQADLMDVMSIFFLPPDAIATAMASTVFQLSASSAATSAKTQYPP
jgi:hypothetical protein